MGILNAQRQPLSAGGVTRTQTKVSSPSDHGPLAVGFISSFWEAYSFTRGTKDAEEPYPGWLYYVVSISSRKPPLQGALLALSITRYARLMQNVAVLRQGYQMYSRALSLLQKALYNEELMLHDDILAAVRTMVLYEVSFDQGINNATDCQVFESTSSTLSSWDSHVAGTARLLRTRGPEQHQAPMPRAVFEDFRYVLVCVAVVLHMTQH